MTKYKHEDPLAGKSSDQLRKIISSLTPKPKRKPSRAELIEQAKIRIAARDLAEERLREQQRLEMREEVRNDPLLRRLREARVEQQVTEQETRARLRGGLVGWQDGDPPELDEDDVPLSPAEAALARFARGDAARVQDMARAEWPEWTDQGDGS